MLKSLQASAAILLKFHTLENAFSQNVADSATKERYREELEKTRLGVCRILVDMQKEMGGQLENIISWTIANKEESTDI